MRGRSILAQARRLRPGGGLDTLILFVTNTCNLHCGFCCYADNLNRAADIPFAGMERISATIGRFRSLLVSGGEPFVREDLAEVLSLFVGNNRVESVSIPTNGWFRERTLASTRAFLERSSSTILTLSFSVDGLKATHDRLRGREGSFGHLCQTLRDAHDLRCRHANLRLRVNTVVTPENHSELEAVASFFRREFELDEHAFELVRDLHVDSARHESKQRQALSEDFLQAVEASSRTYLSEDPGARRSQIPGASRWLSNLATYAFARATAEVKVARTRGQLWPFPCVAGRRIWVIDGSGSLKACEHRAEVVDLRQFDFDVRAALAGGALHREVERIARERCDCLHGCFIGCSLQSSPRSVATRMVPKAIEYVHGAAPAGKRRAICFSAHPPTLRAQAIADRFEDEGWSVLRPVGTAHAARVREFVSIFAANLIAALARSAEVAIGFKPHLNVTIPLMICKLRGMRTWIDVDDLDHAYRRGWISRIVEWCGKPFLRRFDRVSYHNENLRRYLVEEAGCAPERLQRIEQGVHVESFDQTCIARARVSRRVELGLDGHPTAIFVANLNLACDLGPILVAWARLVHRLPDAHLLVVGDGPQRREYEQRAAVLGVTGSVQFVGHVAHVQIPDYLTVADVGLVYWTASTANLYRCSLKLREYFAAGLPVVCNDVGELGDFASFTYQSKSDPADFAIALGQVLTGGTDGREHQARSFALEHCDWKRVLGDRLCIGM